jgi:hypothetical protein
MAEVNIVGPKFDPIHDTKLFNSIEEDERGVSPELIHITSDDRSMAHLLARIGKFPSVGDAKRNGWDKPIPSGWHHIVIGKGAKRWDIYLWNPSTSMDEYTD